ncbi:hypothetical protein ACEQ8H_000291 [Pleosporales sp. CAS-2024a]
MAVSNIPVGHPVIPAGVDPQDIVAIVSIHSVRASHSNRPSPYAQTDILRTTNLARLRVVTGTNIFLHRIGQQVGYSMGRAMINPHAHQELLDIYLPGSRVAKRQCVLVPDWQRECWRLVSASMITTMVNDAPIQLPSRKTQNAGGLPHIAFLDQAKVNTVTVDGLRIEIWLLKSVRDVHGPDDFVDTQLNLHLQDVSQRPEAWAQRRFILTNEQVSGKTFRVIERFTGEKMTAKIFQVGNGLLQIRDEEFLALAKKDIDASIVRYRQTSQIDGVPAIITDTHLGFESYGSLRDMIHMSHPGVRFSIASKLTRALFAALAWMHHHGIIHGHVSSESVLIRRARHNIKHVLLVDYTTARPTHPGTNVSTTDMLADGRAAMKLIEDCCDIWAFRNGPKSSAQGEYLMQERTMSAMREYKAVQRCSADFFERKGNLRTSEKGEKLIRLLNKLGNAWKSAEGAQKQNLLEREVALMSRTKIQAKIKEWESTNPSLQTVDKQYMVLTLGHPILDSLADSLYVKPWDTMPGEVCAGLKQVGGSIEEPWQNFSVQINTATADMFAWLIRCCEIYPEWRDAIETEVSHRFDTKVDISNDALFADLYNALCTYGSLPDSMTAMFDLIVNMDDVPAEVVETYQVSYHVPSNMFNATQLQRLATPERVATAVNEGRLCCHNFVEVRGDAKVEGCYAPLSLLAEFVEQLGLQLLKPPGLSKGMPTFDPADFSQVPHTRIVLGRPGLIGFASMLRTADQAGFLYSRMNHTFITPSAFIPTYFGDMEVLPIRPHEDRVHTRPEDWSKYVTAKEYAAMASRRTSNQAEKTVLAKLLLHRERIRAAARAPKSAVSEEPWSSPTRMRLRTPSPKPRAAHPNISVSFIRRMEHAHQNPKQAVPQISRGRSFMNTSFARRNSALLDPAPDDPTNVNSSFTVGDETEGLDDDWNKVNKLLSQLGDDEDEHMEGITGFRYHGSMVESESEDDAGTEIDPRSFNAPMGPSCHDHAHHPPPSHDAPQSDSDTDRNRPAPPTPQHPTHLDLCTRTPSSLDPTNTSSPLSDYPSTTQGDPTQRAAPLPGVEPIVPDLDMTSSSRAHSPHPHHHPSTSILTSHTPLFDSPNHAIHDFLHAWSTPQHADGDQDMPDTDSE